MCHCQPCPAALIAECLANSTPEGPEPTALLSLIDETIISRGHDGILSLGRKFQELAKEEKAIRTEADLTRLLDFIRANPDCEMEHIIAGLSMGKKTILPLLKQTTEVLATGKGVRGDPFKYSVKPFNGDPQRAASAFAQQWT